MAKKAFARFVGFVGPLSLGLILLIGFAAVSVAGQGPIVNFVSAGGPDAEDPRFPSGPGVDKSFSLVAFKFADGSAHGLLVDPFGGGGGLGLWAAIDCVYVEGNRAWVSGVVTRGAFLDANGNVVDATGLFVRQTVQDNGNNNDPDNPDRIGFSIIRGTPWNCALKPGGLFDMPRGQVTVR